MRRLLLALALAFFSTDAAICAPFDYSKMPTEKLIDRLTQIDSEAPGLSEFGTWTGFIVSERPPRMEVGLLGATEPKPSAAMRELVRRGVTALPALLRHLSDARATHLRVGGRDPDETVGGQFFCDEYDARKRTYPPIRPLSECNTSFDAKYTVRVGDVCYMLVGQIVDRFLDAVRYQPTAILYINSPVERSGLAKKTRRDWSGLTPAAHLNSLLADLNASADTDGHLHPSYALVRLRFYYPAAYAALGGENAEKRMKFEAEEKAHTIDTNVRRER